MLEASSQASEGSTSGSSERGAPCPCGCVSGTDTAECCCNGGSLGCPCTKMSETSMVPRLGSTSSTGATPASRSPTPESDAA